VQQHVERSIVHAPQTIVAPPQIIHHQPIQTAQAVTTQVYSPPAAYPTQALASQTVMQHVVQQPAMHTQMVQQAPAVHTQVMPQAYMQTQVMQTQVQQTQMQQTGVQMGAATVQYPMGSRVEYFSEARGGWLAGVVQGFNAATGAYVLDVHPAALPNKMRAVGGGGASASVQGGSVMGSMVLTQQPADLFNMVDRNHDGAITRQEFDAAFKRV